MISSAEMEILALAVLAQSLSEKGKGMGDFNAFFLTTLSPAARKLIEQFRDAKAKAAPKISELWDAFEKQQSRKGTGS